MLRNQTFRNEGIKHAVRRDSREVSTPLTARREAKPGILKTLPLVEKPEGTRKLLPQNGGRKQDQIDFFTMYMDYEDAKRVVESLGHRAEKIVPRIKSFVNPFDILLKNAYFGALAEASDIKPLTSSKLLAKSREFSAMDSEKAFEHFEKISGAKKGVA